MQIINIEQIVMLCYVVQVNDTYKRIIYYLTKFGAK